ncbi:unnamed protein product [Linum tenue]|uniref:Uncharacterized protein n=1 Tax=Linum tenue TaxID=586396 RepID=A0AAV0RLR2_9ROSI|nr:unnamed protein product [Linum tenue]CAI0557620.1 unnamed protein product [Linum tenue]
MDPEAQRCALRVHRRRPLQQKPSASSVQPRLR